MIIKKSDGIYTSLKRCHNTMSNATGTGRRPAMNSVCRIGTYLNNVMSEVQMKDFVLYYFFNLKLDK